MTTRTTDREVSGAVVPVPDDLTGGTVSYFAAAVVRGPKGWSASSLELRGVTDVEDVADRLRDVDPDAEVSLLFIEADDEYFAILRLDEGTDLRVFASDAAFAEESRLGSVLLADLEDAVVRPPIPDDDDDFDAEFSDPAELDIEPVGDADLLSDLGISARRLIALCAQDAHLPSDITAEICQILGCLDEVEELREA